VVTPYVVQIEMRHTVGVTDTPESELVIEYTATILAGPDGEEEPVVVGRVAFHVVRVGLALDRDQNALDACDAVGQEVYDLAVAVLDEATGQLREDVAVQFEWTGGDVMLLHHLEVIPEHRGQHLGLVVVDRLIDLFVDGLVVCQPAGGDDRSATARLRRYVRALGFEALDSEDGYYALSTAVRRPSVKLRARPDSANDNE
jgi:hypothetical protein